MGSDLCLPDKYWFRDPRGLSRPELEAYFEQFMERRDLRIRHLHTIVTLSEPWEAALTAESVTALAEWFAPRVAVRPHTSNELRELRKILPRGTDPEEWTLTDETFSTAFDIGTYFDETLRRNYPHLRWTQFLNDRRFADYGLPVLVGFGRVPLNPQSIVTNFAWGIASHEGSPDRLSELYLYWAARAAGELSSAPKH